MKNRTNTTNTHNNTPWVLCCTTSGLARSLWGMDLIIWYFPCSKGHYQPITSDTRTWVFMAKTVSIISHYNYIVLKKKTTSQLHLGFPPHIYPTHLTHFFFLCWISTYFFFTKTYLLKNLLYFQVFIANRLVLLLCSEVAFPPQKLWSQELQLGLKCIHSSEFACTVNAKCIGSQTS